MINDLAAAFKPVNDIETATLSTVAIESSFGFAISITVAMDAFDAI